MRYLINNKKLVHYIITIILLFGFAYIPPIAPLTETGMAMLGVFIGAVYGWSTIGMLFPSLLALVAMGLELGMTTVLAASFGNPVIMMMILMLVVMNLLTETGATEVIASMFLTNKLSLGKPWRFMALFFFAVFVCSIVNPIISIMLFMAFLRQICISLDIPLKSPFTAIFAIGIALSALLGQTCLPFYNAGLSYSVTYASMFGTQISYAKWIFYFILMGIVIILATVFVARFIIRIDVSKLKELNPEIFGEKKKFTTEQKIPIGAFLIFVLIILISSFLPQDNPLVAFFTKLTIFGQVAIIAAALMLLYKEDGAPYFNFNAVAGRGLSWDIIFMVALIMPLAQFLCAENTGVTPFLAMLLQPLMQLPPMIFIIIALVVAVALTNIANNFVVAMIIMPVIYTFAAQIGMNPLVPIMVLFVCTQLAIATPGASFPVGICYSFSDIVDAPMMMKYACIMAIGLVLIILLIAYPIAIVMF